jgi:catechol 2,3-dioxygenase-like lactoylglutathione lyase family enzyme
MPARINHIATMSTNPMAIGTMYESIFGLNFDTTPKPANYGEVLTDGNVHLNLHHRLPGQRLGLDHFGVEVDNLEETFDLLKSKYPTVGWVSRPKSCPYGGYMSHDIEGSIFAITEKSGGPVKFKRETPTNFSRWSDGNPEERNIHHYAIRTRNIEKVAQFYHEVFGFEHTIGQDGDTNHYLSDGKVTLMLIPWTLDVYAGISVTGRGPDHIGFKVEDAALVEREIEGFFSHYSPGQSPLWVLTTFNDRSEESQIRAAMIDKQCPMSSYSFTDKDGTFVAIGDKTF